MLGIPRDAECDEEGDEEQRRKHWRSWQMVKEGGAEKKEQGRGGKERKGTGEASEKAATELRKEVCQKGLDALSKAHSFLGIAPAT
jgi:hypothetical protein